MFLKKIVSLITFNSGAVQMDFSLWKSKNNGT